VPNEYLNLLREREAEAERLVESAKARGDRLQEQEAEKLLAEWRRIIARAEGASG
jgi:F0F1-type ATP synthase membrane subunit b/b'